MSVLPGVNVGIRFHGRNDWLGPPELPAVEDGSPEVGFMEPRISSLSSEMFYDALPQLVFHQALGEAQCSATNVNSTGSYQNHKESPGVHQTPVCLLALHSDHAAPFLAFQH